MLRVRQFSPLSDISQGSVETHLRCGEIFGNGNDIIAKFLLSSDSDGKTISKIRTVNI